MPDGDLVVETGSPADVIATSARLRGASLLVIGLGTCPVRDRLLGEELALAIGRRTRTPILAVAPGHTSSPKRIVVGMDFSPASYSACEAALEIADQDALIVLANVLDANTRCTPSGALWRLVDKVQTGFPGRVTAVERHGDPASQLQDIAVGTRADTIVVGGHGQTAAMETALGPAATRTRVRRGVRAARPGVWRILMRWLVIGLLMARSAVTAGTDPGVVRLRYVRPRHLAADHGARHRARRRSGPRRITKLRVAAGNARARVRR